MRGLLRKIRKIAFALRDPRRRAALKLGAGAAIEHADILRNLPRAPATVVDVGANVGQFALIVRDVLPGAHVHSFEPVSATADTFAAVFAGDRQVTLHRCALAAAPGEAKINLSARADSSSLLENAQQDEVFPGTATVGTETVRLTPLDGVMGAGDISRPALLKLDVQGFELEALKGCETLLDRFDHIYAELSFIELYAGQPMAGEVIAWLRARGFELDTIHVEPGGQDAAGRTIQADFLFSRTGAQTVAAA